MGKTVCNLVKDKTKICLCFPSCLAFKKSKKISIDSKNCLRQVKKQHFKVKLWNWVPTKIWHNFSMY